jgi:hypothetical protein
MAKERTDVYERRKEWLDMERAFSEDSETLNYDNPVEAMNVIEEYQNRENIPSELISETVGNTTEAEMLRLRLDALDAQYDFDRVLEWDMRKIYPRHDECGRRVYTGQTEQPGPNPGYYHFWR